MSGRSLARERSPVSRCRLVLTSNSGANADGISPVPVDENMTVSDLKNVLSAKGLNTNGRKNVLIWRQCDQFMSLPIPTDVGSELSPSWAWGWKQHQRGHVFTYFNCSFGCGVSSHVIIRCSGASKSTWTYYLLHCHSWSIATSLSDLLVVLARLRHWILWGKFAEFADFLPEAIRRMAVKSWSSM